ISSGAGVRASSRTSGVCAFVFAEERPAELAGSFGVLAGRKVRVVVAGHGDSSEVGQAAGPGVVGVAAAARVAPGAPVVTVALPVPALARGWRRQRCTSKRPNQPSRIAAVLSRLTGQPHVLIGLVVVAEHGKRVGVYGGFLAPSLGGDEGLIALVLVHLGWQRHQRPVGRHGVHVLPGEDVAGLVAVPFGLPAVPVTLPQRWPWRLVVGACGLRGVDAHPHGSEEQDEHAGEGAPERGGHDAPGRIICPYRAIAESCSAVTVGLSTSPAASQAAAPAASLAASLAAAQAAA